MPQLLRMAPSDEQPHWHINCAFYAILAWEGTNWRIEVSWLILRPKVTSFHVICPFRIHLEVNIEELLALEFPKKVLLEFNF